MSGPGPALPTDDNKRHAERLEEALFEVKRVIVGQDRMVERAMVCLLARGHCLIEGVPGLAKTLTVSTLAQVVGGSFTRLQFTPDLVPADIVGTRVWRPSREDFDIEWGPVFANLVLADEINRAPPRCSRRCSRSWPSGTSRSRGRPVRHPPRSSSSRPRTRSSPKVCTPCPKRNATGS